MFGEGVVNDATSIVLFNSAQSLDYSKINATITLKLIGNFLYLFFTSTALGIAVSLSLWLPKFSSHLPVIASWLILHLTQHPVMFSGGSFKCFYHKNSLLWKVWNDVQLSVSSYNIARPLCVFKLTSLLFHQQAFYWSRSCTYDSYGLFFIHGSWGTEILIPHLTEWWPCSTLPIHHSSLGRLLQKFLFIQ